MRINEADVAELVDARDLKSPAATELVQLSCKTANGDPIKIAANPPHLQNANGGKMSTQKQPRFVLTDKDGKRYAPFRLKPGKTLNDIVPEGGGLDIQVVRAER